jgi:hypothetical protein
LIQVVALSPNNELPVVERLKTEIGRMWPDLKNAAHDRVDLLVGVRTAGEVDLLVAVDFARPRRFAETSNGYVCSALIAIEIKQLDPSRFTQRGSDLFADYRDGVKQRGALQQARDGMFGLKAFATESGFADLFIYALAWLTEVPPAQLASADPTIVGTSDWAALLTAAARQRPLVPDGDAAFERQRAGVRAVRERLANRRKLTTLDKIKWGKIANDAAASEIVGSLAAKTGTSLVRLTGHGGTGKTSALVLLSKHLAAVEGRRVLLLTFHHALRGDIAHALRAMPDSEALLGNRIHVETTTDFLVALVDAAGGDVPRAGDGKLDYERLDATYREVAAALRDGAGGLMSALRADDPARFAWGQVLVDEAQDCSDAERDLLLAAYGAERIAIADGLAQLVRRQTPCDWPSAANGTPVASRALTDSMRMQGNVARFVNAFARAAGFADWRVNPRDDMPGGRILIAVGAEAQDETLVRALHRAGKASRAEPGDCLICVPHTNVRKDSAGKRSAAFAASVAAAGGTTWDATDDTTRGTAPGSSAEWRILQYDSCRGLEGWITVLLDLDDLYAQKLRYPNFAAGETNRDPEAAARRWLLIPLTRAVHMLVITVRDPQSVVHALLREAGGTLPDGLVEWCAATDCAARV